MPNPRGRPKKQELVVSPEQKVTLRQLLQQPRSSRSLAFRARIILECANGQNNVPEAAKLHTTGFTGVMWGIGFISGGVAVLGEEARRGAPRKMVDARVDGAVHFPLEEVPKGQTHGSIRA